MLRYGRTRWVRTNTSNEDFHDAIMHFPPPVRELHVKMIFDFQLAWILSSITKIIVLDKFLKKSMLGFYWIPAHKGGCYG
jgi:hypothetical protein